MKGSLYFALCFLLLLMPIFPFYAQQQNYHLDFEVPVNHENSITENGHEFYFKSKTVLQFSRSGQESWQCNEKDGNFGSIKMLSGTFNLHSLWWGTYEVTFCGFKNNVLKYKNTLPVGSEFQEIRFDNWEDLDSLTLESAQKYNQLYVDDLEYSCFSCENTEILAQNTENENVENQEVHSGHIDLASSQSLLDFDRIFGNENWVVSQERHFIVHSKAFSHLGFQGSRAWQCNDGQGNTGSLKIERGYFDLHSFQIRRPWGKFETTIKGFRNDTLKYTFKVLVSDDFQQIKFDNWLSINEIKIESEKPYNQLYIDNLVYTFDSLGKNNQQNVSLDSVRLASDFVKSDNVKVISNLLTDLQTNKTDSVNTKIASDVANHSEKIIALPENKIEKTQEKPVEIIQKIEQSLQFLPIPENARGETSFVIKAKSSANLPVSYQIVSGSVRLQSDTVFLFGKDETITIKAVQIGNEKYLPTETEISFDASKKTQEISFQPLASKYFIGEKVDLQAKSSANLPLKFEIISGKAIIENNKIIPLSNSNIEIKISQEGNFLYKAVSASQKFYAKTSMTIEDQFSNRLHKGEELQINFTVQENFDDQNEFELLISDANGNFENAKVIAKTSNNQRFFKFQVPDNLEVGNGYRLRVRATKPQRLSLSNENDLTIRATRFTLPSIKKNMNILVSSSLNDNQWFLNGKAIAGATQNQLEINNDGIYTVEVNTPNGKMMSKPLEIKADDPDQVLASNAPMSARQIVAKAKMDRNKIRIFPNPNKGRFSLELDEDNIKALHVSIISADDREVFQNTLYYISWYRQDIDISYEKAGIYLIKITTDRGSYSCLLNLRK
ncbi:MAG: T9SS C-terminal target domain-containing protein [Bacteroidetes bacterium]|nr:MAG: T9SS C-terminal target domain-containing protein [Bacteroidota bacterium]